MSQWCSVGNTRMFCKITAARIIPHQPLGKFLRQYSFVELKLEIIFVRFMTVKNLMYPH